VTLCDPNSCAQVPKILVGLHRCASGGPHSAIGSGSTESNPPLPERCEDLGVWTFAGSLLQGPSIKTLTRTTSADRDGSHFLKQNTAHPTGRVFTSRHQVHRRPYPPQIRVKLPGVDKHSNPYQSLPKKYPKRIMHAPEISTAPRTQSGAPTRQGRQQNRAKAGPDCQPMVALPALASFKFRAM